MTIQLENISKRYQNHWVFRNINFRFESENIYAITGANGSGKSTLLQIIAGFLSPNSGSVLYLSDTDVIGRESEYIKEFIESGKGGKWESGKVGNHALNESEGWKSGNITGDTKSTISPDEIFKHISLVSPEMELYDEMNLQESIDFHFSFKKMQKGFTRDKIIEQLNFTSHSQKPIKSFSTGMKQKLKLALAFYSDTPILLLDEPASNLDETAISWYLEHLRGFSTGRLVIIASNQWVDKDLCGGGGVDLG